MSSYTSLLGYVLPVTGDLNGTWGSTLNTQLTQLIEDSIAGYASNDMTAGDWTLTTTSAGASNQARMAILVATGTPGTTRSIYAPKLSKNYVVVNRSNANVQFRGGPGTPTTGVIVRPGVAQAIFWDSVNGEFYSIGVIQTGSTGSVVITSGTTAQRDGSPEVGFFRYNTDLATFEGYSATGWGGVGGGAQAGGVIYENATTITSNYTLTAGRNGSSVGPITINSGVTVTVPSGQRWLVS